MISVKQEDINKILSKCIWNVKTEHEKVTVVSCKTPNGFVLVESSGAVDKNNYNLQIGLECCKSKIIDKIWMLEGYSLANDVMKGRV